MTAVGKSILPIVQMMYDWGEKRIEELYGDTIAIEKCKCETISK